MVKTENEKRKEYIKKNYIQKNIKVLANDLSVSTTTISRIMLEMDINRERDKKRYIIKNYSKMLTSDIAKYFNCSTTAVVSLANHLGIKKHNKELGTNRVFKVHKEYFKTWSDTMAYILGFTIADGYVKNTGTSYSLMYNINSKDISILEYIRDNISPESKIKSLKVFDKRTNKFYNKSILSIHSKDLIYSLEEFGVIQCKTGKEILPNIPDQYKPHFLCGYFDGDGSHGIYNNGYRLSFSCASKTFLEDLQKQICFNFGTINNRTRCYEYVICGKEKCLDLDSLMTKNRDFYLKRKHFV
jgi:hypothetical protein